MPRIVFKDKNNFRKRIQYKRSLVTTKRQYIDHLIRYIGNKEEGKEIKTEDVRRDIKAEETN